MKARYIRVSSNSQKPDRQLRKGKKNETVFTDVVSGSVPFHQREGGQKLLEAVKTGAIDTVIVHSIDRLGRSLVDILRTLTFLDEHKVTLKDDSLGLTSRLNGNKNPVFKLIVSVMGNIVELERETLRERQREGIALAKIRGIYRGRQHGTHRPPKETLRKYHKTVTYLEKGYSIRTVAKLGNIAPGTVQKVKRLMKEQKRA